MRCQNNFCVTSSLKTYTMWKFDVSRFYCLKNGAFFVPWNVAAKLHCYTAVEWYISSHGLIHFLLVTMLGWRWSSARYLLTTFWTALYVSCEEVLCRLTLIVNAFVATGRSVCTREGVIYVLVVFWAFIYLTPR